MADDGRPSFLPGSTPARDIRLYRKLRRLAEGSYGVVYQGQNVETGEVVAMKRFTGTPNYYTQGSSQSHAPSTHRTPSNSSVSSTASSMSSAGTPVGPGSPKSPSMHTHSSASSHHPHAHHHSQQQQHHPPSVTSYQQQHLLREGFPITALREIRALFALSHPNIVRLIEICTSPASGPASPEKLYMVMECLDTDLRSMLQHRAGSITLPEIKCLAWQLLSGVAYMHDQQIMHRDLKPSNLLLRGGHLKIADFGLARPYSLVSNRPLTLPVATLWYRAPELLLGERHYTAAVDLWAVGCILAEMLLQRPLFAGKSEIGQLDAIFSLLGVPDDVSWPGFSQLPICRDIHFQSPSSPNRCNTAEKSKLETLLQTDSRWEVSAALVNLLQGLLALDPKARLSASDALQHGWFAEAPLPCRPEDIPLVHREHRSALRSSATNNPTQ